MLNKSENQTLQTTANRFNDIAEIPVVAGVVLAILGLTILGVFKPGIGMGLAAAALFINWRINEASKLKEAKARAAAYANMIGPLVVGSDNPEENVFVVAEKAKEWREKLKLSGNQYADLLPIIQYPFSPMLYQTGQLSAGWNIYLKELAERQHMANLEWYEGKCPAHLKGLFASTVLPAPPNPNGPV